MALILLENKAYIADTGSTSSTAYLKISPIGQNNKDTLLQEFTVSIYNSKEDKNKVPLIRVQITVSQDEYTQFFSPQVLEKQSIYFSCYEYILMVAKTEEPQGFEWLQGDIWISDEV